MDYRLRKPTQLKRRTFTRLGLEIVPRETGVSDDVLRRISFVAPTSPICYFAVGPQEPIEGDLEGVDNAGVDPEDIGRDRSYQWAPLSGYVSFLIRADQTVVASASVELATLGVVIEYLET